MKSHEVPGVTDEEIKAFQNLVGAKPDGNFGPKSLKYAIDWARDKVLLPPATVPVFSSKRAQVVAIAEAEIGVRQPYKYYEDCAPMYMGTKPNDKSWCGVFALWCLRQAGLSDRMWVDGRGFVEGYLPRTINPEPGDIAYFLKNQHYAIVKALVNGRVYLINGNAMQAPVEGVVANDKGFAEVSVFYSIRNLV
jgi:hypothetical protein